MQLLLFPNDFESFNDWSKIDWSTIYFTLFILIAFLFILEKSFHLLAIILNIKKKDEINSFNRFVMDALAMGVFVLLGYNALDKMGGWKEYFEIEASVDRLYVFNPYAAQLALFQVAYELKSIHDVFYYGDGIIFFLHHISTSILAFCALHPFCQLYACFFLGISEVSTFVLCCALPFDGERGIPILHKKYEIILQILGVVFSILFFIYRCVIWPRVSYHFWKDCLLVLNTQGASHNDYVIYFFLFANAGLTSLQIAWLGEIVTTATSRLGMSDSKKKKNTSNNNNDSNNNNNGNVRRSARNKTKAS